jgi:hypothetical protein
MNFSINDDSVVVVAVMTVDEQGQDGGNEEEDDVPVLTLALVPVFHHLRILT